MAPHKYIGTRPEYTRQGAPLAPGTIVRRLSEDDPLLESGLMIDLARPRRRKTTTNNEEGR